MSDKKYVSIAQAGIMWKDVDQQVKVLGDKIVEVEVTESVLRAVKNNLIKFVEKPKEKAPAKAATAGEGATGSKKAATAGEGATGAEGSKDVGLGEGAGSGAPTA